MFYTANYNEYRTIKIINKIENVFYIYLFLKPLSFWSRGLH